MSDYKFTDLVDIDVLREMLDNLYTAVSIPSAIIDMEGTFLTGVGWQRICIDFHRKNPEAGKLCVKSDIHIRDEISAGKPYVIYQCPHGLVDSCCPIVIEGRHMANVFTGQFLHAHPTDKVIARFRAQARCFGFDEKAYLAALAEVPVFSPEKHRAVLAFLSRLATQIARIGLNNLRIIEQKKLAEESEELYRSMFEANRSIMLLIDPDGGDIVDANPAACEFYGYGNEVIKGKNISDINLLPQDGLKGEMADACCGKRHHFCFTHRLADGSVREVEVYSSPIMRRGRRLLYSIIHDISRQKKSEAALDKSEKRFRALLDQASDAIFVSDPDGRLTLVNKQACDSLGYGQEELLGMSLADIDADFIVKDHPGNVWAGLAPGKTVTVESVHRRRDGSTFPVEIRIGIIELDDSRAILGIVRDITARREFEASLRRSKDEWEKTFDAMEDIVTIHDPQMRILRANRAFHEAFHIEPGAMDGHFCYEVFRGIDTPCPGCPELFTFSDKKSCSRTISHDNLGRVFTVSTAPILDGDEITHVVHIARDITGIKKLEEELFQAHKMEALGTLAGGIAHDFNNMLAAILGYAELAKLNLPADSQTAEYVDQVIKAGNRARDLIRQILTFSRKGHDALQPINPAPVIKEAVKMLKSSLPSTVVIEAELNSECGTILANPVNVHQVLLNLCTNALHAMEKEKGLLTIRLAPVELGAGDISPGEETSPGPFVELLVRDTGEGIAPAVMKRIFEPYFTTKGVGKGSGMGLALVLGIVKSSKGFITVSSEPGRGSTFKVFWPVIEDREAEIGIDDSESLPSGDERILVVDDDKTIADIYRATLGLLGYEVTVYSDSEKALAAFRAEPDAFDLIITDQTMPRLTGSDLAVEVLRLRPEIPIILCTGYSSIIPRAEAARKIGIKRFMLKPVSRNKLARTVRAVLDGE